MNELKLELQALGMTDVFIDHLLKVKEIDSISYYCHKPIEIYKTNLLSRNIVPLWEYGVRITYYDKSDGEYKFVTSLEEEVVWFSANTLQGALATLFESLCGDYMDEDNIRYLADAFGFSHVEKMINEGDDIFDDDVYEKWFREFDRN